jgi:protein-L-isoaspartate(D-aspartate) O-methyltransferase
MANVAMARTNMINGQIIPVGITDRRLIMALSAVPREHFVPVRHDAIGL